MKEVDARGLSCPEPIMMTAEALKGSSEAVRVLVSEPVQRTNVEKYALSHKKIVTVSEVEDGFALLIE